MVVKDKSGKVMIHPDTIADTKNDSMASAIELKNYTLEYNERLALAEKDSFNIKMQEAELNWACIITDEDYRKLTPESRSNLKAAKAVYNDHAVLSTLEQYNVLYRAKKKATQALDDFKWRMRYGK